MKMKEKGLLYLGVGLCALFLELFVVSINLNALNVFTYLLSVGLLPAIILFVTSLLYSLNAKTTKKIKYIVAVMLAFVFSVIMLVFCANMITTELIDIIISNSITADTTQVSMSTASAGDNIQSILLFVAFSGLGVFVGNRIRTSKHKKDKNFCQKDEYDD